MRKLLLAAALGWFTCTNAGCVIPIYSSLPVRRTQQLIFTSDDFRAILDTWERIWHLDQPGHTKPIRTHGGII